MKRFGVRDLARLANVSVGTVDRALNRRNGISEETRRRILAIAHENGYVPNLTARALSFSKSSFRIGLCIPREIHYFYDHLFSGVVEEAQRYAHIGLEVVYRPVKKLSSPVSNTINQLLDEGIQALILTPSGARELAPLIEKAETKLNVRVICVASDDSPSCRSMAISVDPSINGALAAELMAKLVTSPSEVAIFTGMLATEEHRRKVEQFQKHFPVECPGGQVVRLIEGHEEPQEVYRKTIQLLRENPHLGGIYVSTVNSIPVCNAVEERKRSRIIKIIATDLSAALDPYFRRGTLSASIYQNPYRQGQLAIRSILDYFLNGKPFPHNYYLNPVIALRTNLGLFREMQVTPACADSGAINLTASDY